MYYLKLTFFLIVWLIILINQIQRIDMRIEMRERRIVENKQGIYTIGEKIVQNQTRSKTLKLPKFLSWFIPHYNYEGVPFVLPTFKKYTGQRTVREIYLATFVVSLMHYIIGITLFCIGLIIKNFDIPFLLLFLESFFLAPVELYYAKKK